MLISVLIAIFASAGSVVAFSVLGNKTSTKPDVTELISPVEEEKRFNRHLSRHNCFGGERSIYA